MTITKLPRRQFIKQASLLSAAGFAATSLPGCGLMGRSDSQPQAADIGKDELPFRLSLAQWSLHQRFFSGKADPMDFAAIARQEFDLDGIEYVSQFYADKLSHNLLMELEHRAEDQGVRSLLIMVDGEGALGDPDDKARTATVENHKKWAEAAVQLGCHSIRVNEAVEKQIGKNAPLRPCLFSFSSGFLTKPKKVFGSDAKNRVQFSKWADIDPFMPC